MERNDDELTLEGLDDQIEWHARELRSLPPGGQLSPTTRLIQGLRRSYENDQADEQSVEAVWQRLAERGAVSTPRRQRSRQARPHQSLPATWQPSLQGERHPRRWSLAARLTAIAAAVVLVVLVGGLAAGLVLVRQPKGGFTSQATATPGHVVTATTAPSAPSEISYIGSDGNIWEMTVPNGTPQQWTNQAKAGSVEYSGLAWSPDGSRLAALRTDIGAAFSHTYTLLIFSSDGTLARRIALPGKPDGTPFAWSPDGKSLAYRDFTGEFNDVGGINKLVLFDAASGNMIKSVTYLLFEGSGCGGGGGWPLVNAIASQHQVGFGIQVDTFAWAPDQSSMMVAYGCNDGTAVLVDLQTGNEITGFPEGSSYQPDSNLILGILVSNHSNSGGAIGLTDSSGKKVRTLVVNPDVPAYTGPEHYALLIGRAVWSQDGQSVYYEYDDSIWQVQADGSNAHMVVPGTALDSQNQVTIQMLGALSSNGQMLLYLQLKGIDDENSTAPVASQWYIAQADGSHAAALPSGISDVVWRPAK